MWRIIVKILMTLLLSRQCHGVFGIWSPNLNPAQELPWSNPAKLPQVLSAEAKIAEIINLNPWKANDEEESVPNVDVCTSEACLTQALNAIRAINFSVDPCDNFFEFACGNWIRRNPIPGEYGSWDVLSLMDSHVKFNVINILKSKEDTQDPKPLNQGKTFYASCIDTNAIEKVGLQPLVDIIEKYGGLPLLNPTWSSTNFNLSTLVGVLLRDFGLDSIVQSFVGPNLLHARENIINVYGPEFLLPAEFLASGEKYPQIISAYKTFFVSAFSALAKAKGTEVSMQRLEKGFQDVYALEKLLAIAYLESSNLEEDVIATETLTEFLKSLEPITNGVDPRTKMDWAVILEEEFANSGVKIQPNDKIYTPVKAYVARIMEVVQGAKPDTLTNYMFWRLTAGLAAYTTQTMMEIRFNFSKAVTGVGKLPERENTCARTTLNNFGFPVSVAYVREHVKNTTKPEVGTMIEHLRTAFIQKLKDATWLSDSTRMQAMEKAEAILKNVAYPDWFNNKTEIERQFAGLEVTPSTFFQNVLNVLTWMMNDNFKQLRIPAGRNEWLISPAVVNAVYDETKNTITFPAGILQPPLFVSKGLKSINYGGIGVVMGHEITHGFDTRGSYFDGEGNYQNWWKEADRKQFDTRADCFRMQYSKFNTSVGHVDGNQTIGENIADNGGLGEAFRAYQNWIHQTRGGEVEQRLFGIHRFTNDQLFFLGFGQTWCGSRTPGSLANQLLTDVHSPGRFRVIGTLQNSPEFSKAWNCKTGSYMNPPNKCKLW